MCGHPFLRNVDPFRKNTHFVSMVRDTVCGRNTCLQCHAAQKKNKQPKQILDGMPKVGNTNNELFLTFANFRRYSIAVLKNEQKTAVCGQKALKCFSWISFNCRKKKGGVVSLWVCVSPQNGPWKPKNLGFPKRTNIYANIERFDRSISRERLMTWIWAWTQNNIMENNWNGFWKDFLGPNKKIKNIGIVSICLGIYLCNGRI